MEKMIEALKIDWFNTKYGYVPTKVFLEKYGTASDLKALEKAKLVTLKVGSYGYQVHIK